MQIIYRSNISSFDFDNQYKNVLSTGLTVSIGFCVSKKEPSICTVNNKNSKKILLEKIYKTGLTTMNNFEFIGLKIHNKCLSLFDCNEKKMNERWFNLALLCYFLEILYK